MRVLICGDRNWTDRETIRQHLSKLPKGSVVIHGACRGADKIAGEIAKELGLKVEEYPADWNHYGLSAGPIRNLAMLKTLNKETDRVLAFHPDLSKSKGTAHTVDTAKKREISTEVIEGKK